MGAMIGGGLVSGVATIRETLAAVGSGTILSYQDIINMTRTDGWKSR
jgi:hypothetical protein